MPGSVVTVPVNPAPLQRVCALFRRSPTSCGAGRVQGVGVGRGVGLGVGRGVAIGVGCGVGTGAGRGVGAAVASGVAAASADGEAMRSLGMGDSVPGADETVADGPAAPAGPPDNDGEGG